LVLPDDELERLAFDLESDRVERKESLAGGSRDRVAQAVCAFANDLPGHRAPGLVVIGLRDDLSPSGFVVTDQALLTLGAIRSDGNILPLPTMTVVRRQLRGQDLALVLVEPSRDTPVRYDGRVWIRVGPRRAIASRDEERILTERRQSAELPFDRRTASGADLTSLDLDFFRNTYLPAAVAEEVVAENGRPIEHQLAGLRLIGPSGEPTYAGLLLLGKDPQATLPGAYLTFVRFAGTTLDAPIVDQKQLTGRVGEVLREADILARLNVQVATTIAGMTTEQRRPDYPETAIQQLVRNAVLHRSYEISAPVLWYWFTDHLEIHSPGGLYGRVTPENFGQRGITEYRNPGLAEGLRHLGFVQRFGWGIQNARKACEINGNPPPGFTFAPSQMLVEIRSR
jgi:ATP-dependent DNA helicase RecG